MTVKEICALPVGELAEEGAHLWLWTTNEYLRAGFEVIEAWGFRYLAPVTWVKPSGLGCWFIHRTQTLLMGYKNRCVFNRARYKPTVLEAASPLAHSAKPHESYELIESISDGPRLEIFARPWTPLFPKRDGWQVWGNELPSDVPLTQNESTHRWRPLSDTRIANRHGGAAIRCSARLNEAAARGGRFRA